MKWLFILASILCVCACESEADRARREIERARQKQVAAQRQVNAQREIEAAENARKAISDLGSDASAEELVRACGIAADALVRLPEIAQRCADAYLTLAQSALAESDIAGAALNMRRLKMYTGVTSEKIEALYAETMALEREAEAAAASADAVAASVEERKKYALKLRDHFLDEGMDVKVRVQGSENQVLYLNFVLFNDVWMHKFKKGQLFLEIRRKGFEQVILESGYGWSDSVNL